MAFRFTIGRKIVLGFGSLIFLTFVAFGLTLITLTESRQINDKITTLYNPSVSALQELNILVVRSKMLIANWVNVQIDHEDKDKLKIIHDPLAKINGQNQAPPESKKSIPTWKMR